MNQEMSQQVEAVLDQLGARFGATGAELWSEVVRYTLVLNVASALVCVGLSAAFVWGLRLAWNRAGRFDREAVGIFGGIIGLCLIVFTAIAVVTAVATVASPQAAAIRSLIPE